MATKILKYGLGVFAPAPPEGFAPKTERIDIAADKDVGEIRLEYADGVSDYVVTMGARSHASFVIAPPVGRPVSVTTTLAGEGASYEAKSAFCATDNEVIDLRHEVIHAAPHTSSDLKLRGALDGKAKAFARGLVRIPKGMVGCVGRQREEFLMLGGTPEVAAMPDLEIACHEVQCGHAATTSRIDPEKLHYFESRGITRDEAKEMIVEGFLAL